MRGDDTLERKGGPTAETRRLLSLHLDGELDATRQAVLDARIDECAVTQAELAFWKRFRTHLAEESTELDATAPATGRVADAVMATIGARNREVAVVLPFVRRLSAAAAVLLVLTGGLFALLATRTDENAPRLEISPSLDLERSLTQPDHMALFGDVPAEPAKPEKSEDGSDGSGR